MMRYLSLKEIFTIHNSIISSSGGASGVRDLASLKASLGQPHQTFDGNDLYPDLISKASILCYSIVMNHPFIDGNKRVGHAVMEVFLMLNGFEIEASVDEQEKVMLRLAEGSVLREEFEVWLRANIKIT
ncbi:MAG: type II toxin-antitoxin system death-on-curing family toxin [Desulfobacteraceae bacterium]